MLYYELHAVVSQAPPVSDLMAQQARPSGFYSYRRLSMKPTMWTALRKIYSLHRRVFIGIVCAKRKSCAKAFVFSFFAKFQSIPSVHAGAPVLGGASRHSLIHIMHPKSPNAASRTTARRTTNRTQNHTMSLSLNMDVLRPS